MFIQQTELFSSSYRFSSPLLRLALPTIIHAISNQAVVYVCEWKKICIAKKSEEAFTNFKAYFKNWNTMRLRTWPVEDNRLKNKWPQVHLRMTSVWLCSKLLFEVRKEQIPFCLRTKLGACSLLSIYCASVWWVSAWKNSPKLKEWTNYFVKNSVKLYICTNYRTQFCIDVKGFHAQTTSIAVFPDALQALLCLCTGLWHRSIHPVILPSVHKSKTFELS